MRKSGSVPRSSLTDVECFEGCLEEHNGDVLTSFFVLE